MKKDLPVGVIATVVLVALAAIGYFAYNAIRPPDVSVPDPNRMKQQMQAKYQSGATPAPAAVPPGASAPKK